MTGIMKRLSAAILVASTVLGATVARAQELEISEAGYYEADGVNVMMFDDFYPEGHQGGLTVIQRGVRTAANGDLRLEETPGQWAPTPVMGEKKIDRTAGTIRVRLWYPDSSKDRKGFNPLVYPDLRFRYTVRTESRGGSILLTVDLDESLPPQWQGRVGFNSVNAI
jgi:endoglucanase